MTTFRGYRDGDVDAMYALDLLCFAEPFRFTHLEMRRFAEGRRARVVIAEEGGEITGFCIVQIERPATGYLVTLDVAPERRSQGLGTILMQRGENEARDAGCSTMELHVFRGNDVAIRFYKRLGYEAAGAAKSFYGNRFDALIYRKPLAR